MEYLKRNKALLKEIRQRKNLAIGKELARNERGDTHVFSLGDYHSCTLGGNLHLALKVYENKKSTLDIVVARDLGLMRVIESRFPHLLTEFPIIHGLVIDKKGEKYGIVTEDFTLGGKHDIYPELHNLPRELANAFEHKIDDLDLETTCFYVNGVRRIGDFGEFYADLSFKDWDRIFPYRDIHQSMGDVTIQLK